MTFKQLTNINLLKLENKLNIIEDELRKIRKLTNKNIWIQDLNELTLYLTK
jgi:tRNA 2-selenouridine synthase SelU